jgi:crotonobetainyl-CoA:carnitine CoA-transferase CaiB-like acyl-CoA transferase
LDEIARLASEDVTVKCRDLEGIVVVSVEQAVAAPYLSARLAEAGARVIKIERPEGDFARGYDHLVKGESAYFVWLNRGKESVCLDLREDAARDALAAMIARADVFIQNLAPGAIDRLGFAPAELRARHPRLITVSISGYGEDGPYREMKAYDLLVQGESGLSAITGTPEGMARVGVSVCDIAAGMTAHQAVLQALFARERSGQGRHVAVSLFHALADWMNVPYLQYVYGGKEPDRSGLNHPTIAPYGAYAGGDGRAVLFAIQNEREWARFCAEVIERPELAADPRFDTNSGRVANRAELDAAIRAAFAPLSRDDIVARLEAARVAYGRISSMDDLARHPQNRFAEVETPSGPVTLLGPGTLFDGEASEHGPVPALGQHTQAVLEEFAPADG